MRSPEAELLVEGGLDMLTLCAGRLTGDTDVMWVTGDSKGAVDVNLASAGDSGILLSR